MRIKLTCGEGDYEEKEIHSIVSLFQTIYQTVANHNNVIINYHRRK